MHKSRFAFPAASLKMVVFTPFLTGSCRDFTYGVKDDIGNQMDRQTRPSSAKKYQLTRKKQVSIEAESVVILQLSPFHCEDLQVAFKGDSNL